VSRADADLLWGAEVVRLALEAQPEALSASSARGIARRVRELDGRAFVRWSLAQPWPRFCAVIRLALRMPLPDEAPGAAYRRRRRGGRHA